MAECNINFIGKARNGINRYWCSIHQAPAYDKDGNQLEKCLEADNEVVMEDQDIFSITPRDYSGGVALWGAAPSIYDNTQLNMDFGIHVHARKEIGGIKQIDKTFKKVCVIDSSKKVYFDGLDAIAYSCGNIFRQNLEFVTCNHCGFPHLDKNWFSVNPHIKHKCSGCGRDFFMKYSTIGNPIMKSKELLNDNKINRDVVRPIRAISIKQSDFPKGLALWGSNCALVWTSPKSEEYGIHIHAYIDSDIPTIDETYDNVTIDGLDLDIEQVRFLMVQNVLPFLKNKITYLECPICNEEHFDINDLAYTPHSEHVCYKCNHHFKTARKVIGNPMINTLKLLSKNSVAPLKNYDILDIFPRLSKW